MQRLGSWRPGRCRSISASVPSNWMNAIVTGGARSVPPPSRTCARIAGDRQRASASCGTISGAGSAALSPWRPEARAAEARPGPWLRPGTGRGSSAAVSVLIRISPASASCSIATTRLHAGPVGSSSRCDVPTAKKWKRPGMHALRHPQRDLRARHLDPADVAQHAAHQHCGATRARGVAVALEPQQQRVAAELEQAARRCRTRPQDRLEAASDRLGDLLRTLAALAREAFGQLREAGDVDERRGAVGGPAWLAGSSTRCCWRIRAT